jgi:hypothetical protein
MLIPCTMRGESQAPLKAPAVRLSWVSDRQAKAPIEPRGRMSNTQHAKSGT